MSLSDFYPVMLTIQHKKVVVVGGGKVAARKVKTLVEAKANIIVVSPHITEELKAMIVSYSLRWKQKEFEAGDVEGAFILIAATDQPHVNEQVYQSKSEGQLINMTDRPDVSDFIVPSTVVRGKLVISVSTSGASPGLTRKIRTELGIMYDQDYEEYVDFLGECRLKVMEEVTDAIKRRHIFEQLLDPVFLELTRSGKLEEREKRFLNLLE